MGYSGDDQVLIRIAVFGIAMSMICTAMITVMFAQDSGGDYDFDEIQSYRDEVSSFTGQSMLNDTPWVLTRIATPWVPSMGTAGHIDEDGWLYGEEITRSQPSEEEGEEDEPYYPYIHKAAGIKLNKDRKSTVPITVSDATYEYDYLDTDRVKWWADTDTWYGPLSEYIFRPVGEFFGKEKYEYSTGTATVWNYSGWRYIFDPTLPFQTLDEDGNYKTAVRDGALSLVWYTYNGQEGLSGGLDVYGGEVLLASYSAVDIITAYNTSSGYATSYEFDFEGTILTLSILFDQDAIDQGKPLMAAWTDGNWSMAITSVSVGNFLDIEGSNSYSTTAGSMIKTFIQIYTLNTPNIGNTWMNVIIWLLVGLPMTLSLALVTLKVLEAVKLI